MQMRLLAAASCSRALLSSCPQVLLDAERPPAGGAVFNVLPPMPRLEVSLDGLPPVLLSGQLVRCTLGLKNVGAMTLHGMVMATGSREVYVGASEPSFASNEPASSGSGNGSGSGSGSGGEDGGKGRGEGAAEGGEAAVEGVQQPDGAPRSGSGSDRVGAAGGGRGVEVTWGKRGGVSVFSLPPGTKLGVGQELTLPLWFR
jgi:hypothetical protein